MTEITGAYNILISYHVTAKSRTLLYNEMSRGESMKARMCEEIQVATTTSSTTKKEEKFIVIK